MKLPKVEATHEMPFLLFHSTGAHQQISSLLITCSECGVMCHVGKTGLLQVIHYFVLLSVIVEPFKF
jgi:hypothetical protein